MAGTNDLTDRPAARIAANLMRLHDAARAGGVPLTVLLTVRRGSEDRAEGTERESEGEGMKGSGGRWQERGGEEGRCTAAEEEGEELACKNTP